MKSLVRGKFRRCRDCALTARRAASRQRMSYRLSPTPSKGIIQQEIENQESRGRSVGDNVQLARRRLYLQYFCRSPSQQIGTDLQTYNQGRSTLNAVADRGAPVPEVDRRELELRQEGLLDH